MILFKPDGRSVTNMGLTTMGPVLIPFMWDSQWEHETLLSWVDSHQFWWKINNANVTWPWHMWPKHWEFILASRLFQRWTTGFFGAAATFKEHHLNLHEEPKMGPTHTTPNMAIWAPEIGGLKHQKINHGIVGYFQTHSILSSWWSPSWMQVGMLEDSTTRQRWYVYIYICVNRFLTYNLIVESYKYISTSIYIYSIYISI